jgi:hypothetical protein
MYGKQHGANNKRVDPKSQPHHPHHDHPHPADMVMMTRIFAVVCWPVVVTVDGHWGLGIGNLPFGPRLCSQSELIQQQIVKNGKNKARLEKVDRRCQKVSSE